MPLVLTREGMRAILPRAPDDIITAFVDRQADLAKAGILETRPRFAFAMANVEHECAGFTIPNLTESIAYTPRRATQVWPSRFKSEEQVYAKVGSSPSDPPAVFRKKLMNSVYGGRMGNRPGTDDGSLYIGRGGPQITGADGYEQVGKRAGMPLKAQPEFASKPEYQPAILAGFWAWKNFSKYADVGDFVGGVKAWNGGAIGMDDRKDKLSGNAAAIARLDTKAAMMPAIRDLPGGPSTVKPPKDVLDAATEKERRARAAGAVTAAPGAASEGTAAATKTGAEQPAKPFLPPIASYTLIGVGVALFIAASVMIARKHAAVVRNWF
jgi:putative chitinase